MHISSIWGDYSEGSFGKEAIEWVDFLAECGFSVWQILPFCLPDDCNSPYKSYSSFSVNPYMIDLPSLCMKGLISEQELNEAKQTTPYSCEFNRLKKERFILLSKAASRFAEWEKVDAFIQRNRHIKKFCEFMALKKTNGQKAWTEWEIKESDKETEKTWQFIEYTFFEQWKKIKTYANKKGISIIGDIPIYVAWDSSDVWANRALFQLDKDNKPKCVAGVPPDYFSKDGQMWGNPLYDWKEMKKDGFLWWRERMEFMCELFDGVRIDHFRGLSAYYSIPASDKNAKNGKWVKGPGMEFIDAIKTVCKDKLLIAEDLGDIDDDVRNLVKDSGWPGMRVMQFGFLGDENSPHLPHNYINNCIAYTGTHDNNTLLGYVWELDDNTRKKLLDYFGYSGSDWNKCYDEILRMLFASHAGMVILPVQDLLLYGSDTRFNVPGRSDGNWSYRITKEQLWQINKEKFIKWNKIYARK